MGQLRRLGPPGGAGLIDSAWGQLVAPLPAWATVGSAVMMGFRPEGVVLSDTLPNEKDNVIEATVATAQYLGDTIEYQLDLNGRLVRVKGEPFTLLTEGQRVFLRIPPERCYVLESMAAEELAAAELARVAPRDRLRPPVPLGASFNLPRTGRMHAVPWAGLLLP